ncbi:hypothetical protein Taro_038556 [Colocasia esculenta]|uniref:Uncharacterized protein n=1 Tax=Colocasia esculenta TaxID=4460 RepID=A0A843W8G1_COLES|nr:hypothetical protein [Colocasia esculenta]
MAIGSHVKLSARSPPQNRHSKTVDKALVSRDSVPGPKFHRGAAKELGITFRPGIGIAYVTTIRNRHSETVDRALVSRDSVLGPKFRRGACVLVHRLSYPSGRTRIFVRPGIETAREAPI